MKHCILRLKKYILISCLVIFLLNVSPVYALNTHDNNEELFKAVVTQVLVENDIQRENGSISIQQKLELKGLEGGYQDMKIIYDGTRYDSLQAVSYKVGDKVIVNQSTGPDGAKNFYILDYLRTTPLYLIALIFALLVILIGKGKGVRAIIVLILTFIIILKYIIPSILAGSNPIFISIFGSLIILFLAIYFTEGINRNSTIAVSSILIALVITGILAVVFTELTKITGSASEEGLFLIGYLGSQINLKGIMLAGIIIGTLGVLDDVVISQTMLVQEFRNTKTDITSKELYKKAMNVGISHLSSMVNTLFLAYAGASLPLLILFGLNEPPFVTFNQVLNNEVITTEIVRTMTGSIGLILAMPIATILAVKFGKAGVEANHHH